MKQRGRPSTASLMAVMPGDRPPPPDELRPDEATEWNKIVERMPPGWFGAESFPILIQLCRQICTARHVAAQLAETEAAFVLDEQGISIRPKGWYDAYREFVRLQNQTSMVLANLAVKLRLAKSSQTDSKVAHTAVSRTEGRPKPWMLSDDDRTDEHAN